MKTSLPFIALFHLITVTQSISQSYTFSRDLSIPVYANGVYMENPWTGGEDAPILQPIDLNGDSIKDLFMFEKTQNTGTHRLTTFLNNGTAGQVDYHFAPEYIEKFPATLHDWVLLADFNCDGKEDIFCYSYTGGMTVYRNDYTQATGLKFSLYMPLIYSMYGVNYTNLFVSAVNQPALIDMDNDGDLDVLTFSLTGSFLEYHRNLAIENYGKCDTLVFTLFDDCWGGVCLSGGGNTAIFGCCLKHTDPDRLAVPYAPETVPALHNGSCLIAPDIDGDGDRDALNGDVLGDSILLMTNTGSVGLANITAQDSSFPVYDVSVNMKTFPGPYYFDADNDGHNDFIVAPCSYNTSRNFKNILFYKNTTNNTTNVFSYQGDSLLVNDMIDVGTNANVAVADIDGDGLKDMLIGNYRYVYQVAPDDARIACFRNNGTTSVPQYALATNDLAGLSVSGQLGLAPTFGDLDGDNDMDMIVAIDSGDLRYYENNGSGVFTLITAQMTDVTSNKIDVGNTPAPVLADLNLDGTLDLVIGEQNGNLNYYENTGTPSAYAFTFVTDSLGKVNTTKKWKDLYGYSYPFFYNDGGNYILFCGTLSGYVYRYDNISGNLGGVFTLTDSMLIYEPFQSTVSGGDYNNDGVVDLLIGNKAGGVTWYSGSVTSTHSLVPAHESLSIYPNPASGYFNIVLKTGLAPGTVAVYDMRGHIVYQTSFSVRPPTIHTGTWSTGLYYCRVVAGDLISVKKIVVTR